MNNDNYSQIELEDLGSEEIKEPLIRKIDITTKQMILEVFFRRLRNNEINMNTVFQREADLWDPVKQSRLIESILIKLPLPAFTLMALMITSGRLLMVCSASVCFETS